MNSFAGSLGTILAFVLGSILIGAILNAIFDLIKIILRFIFRTKKQKLSKLSFKQDLIKCFLIGFPIPLAGSIPNVLPESSPDAEKGTFAVAVLVICYIIVYFLIKKVNRTWYPERIIEKSSSQKQKSPNFIKRRLIQLKSISLGVYRIVFILSFLLPLFLAIVANNSGGDNDDIVFIFSVVPFWLLYWIIVCLTLWVYDGFKTKE